MSRSSLRFGGSKTTGSKCLAPNRLSAAILLALSGPVYALPQGGVVAAGDAAIEVNGDTMQVLQNSQRAILNFQSFDIGSGQTVNFQQPDSDAVALNRVLGDRLSEIHGALNANGQVYLINPNGVVFGNGAELNVGGLVVTTLDITDQDFLAGRDAFNGGSGGRVENHGSIAARDRVVLLAPEVENTGNIQVPNGDILLRSSRQALLHTAGSEIPILVDDPELVGRVTNEGTLRAGEVALVLDGSGRGNVYDSAINNSGLVRAVRASGEGGEIHLLSGAAILNSGALDASAEAGAGGEITLAAETINQSGQITAKAAGTGEGGEISLLATNAIAMHSGSLIDASADQVGDAGDVVIIAEKSTWFTSSASINARGGTVSGDGGFVEVSGLEFISIDGAVNVGADNGNSGLWFIDPTDIEINPGNNVGGSFDNLDPNTWKAQSDTSTGGIGIGTLFNTINNDGNVKIVTTSNGTGTGTITFNTVLNINNLGTQNAGRVNTLELVADDQIIFTADGGIWDSAPGGDGVNLNFTAEKGFIVEHVGAQPDGRGVVNSGLGKLNINVLDGDALITGLASAAAAADAIRLNVQNGKIIDNGDSLWDVKALDPAGGVVLQARGDIGTENNGLDLDVTYLSAVSLEGDVRIAAMYDVNEGLPATNYSVYIDQLSAANFAGVHSSRIVWVTNPAAVDGGQVQLSSTQLLVLPQDGLSVSGKLTLLAPDIVANNPSDPANPGRTLALGATDLTIDTSAAGGNLQIDSTVDSISITNRHTNAITVNDTDAITLWNIDPLAGAISISSGDGTDLTVGTDLNLSNKAGSLSLGAGRNLFLNASIVDTDGSGITLTAPGNVIFASDSTVDMGTGNITITANTGNVALGALTGGTITVSAGGAISDVNGAGVNISGTSATLTAGAGGIGVADGLETSVGSLTLNSGNGAYLSNNQTLTLTSLDIIGDLNISLPTAGNLTLSESNPTITGNATFSVANGQLIVPDAGWNTAGNLTVNATRIVDSNSSATVSLTANNADLTLTGAVASTLNVDFNTLALQLSGGQTVQVNDDNDLTLNNISNNGNLTVTTEDGSDLTITDTTPVSSGQLTLNAGRNLVLSTAGLNVAGNLMIVADDVRDGDGDADVSLGAANADITLRNAVGARSWSTSFNQLVLDIAGTGNFELTDTDGLTLTSVDTGGSASFTTTGADLVLTTQLQVAGDLALRTTGAGNVVVPDARFAHVGNLVIDANDLLDTNRTLSLEATSADIRLRNPGGNHTWTTQLGSLALEMGGTADIQLTDEDGLTLTGLGVGGNATIGTTGADLVLLTAPDVDGVLSLTTTTSGDLVIDDDGLMHGGGLIIVARNIRNSDDSTITLGATNADITLRDGGQAQTWNTSFTQLALQIAGAGDFDLTDTDGLTLTAVSTGGNASFRTTGADLVLNSTPNVDGALTLATVGPGDVVIPNGGLQHTDELTITADNLRGSDADLRLSATTANITLRNGGTQARNWTTTFDELMLDLAGTGDFNLTNANALILSSITTGGNASVATLSGGLTLGTGTIGGNAAFTAADGDLEFINAPTFSGDLSLTANSGAVIVDDLGLIVTGDLTINAEDLRDSDADVTLTADTANITLRNGGTQARDWATTFNELVLDITGTGDFELTNAGALILTSVNTDGNASFTTSSGDLTLSAGSIDGNAAFSAAGDLVMTSAPTITGDLSLTTGNGDVIVSDGLSVGGDLTVDADDLRDIDGGDLTLVADNANITLRDTGAQARAWTTTFDELALSIAGTGDFSLTNTDTLILSSITTGGNASIATLSGGLTLGTGSIGGNAAFTAADGDLEFTNAPTFSGDLSLTASSGAVIVDDAGLIVTGDLTIDARDLRGSNADLTLEAATANITLSAAGSQARTWTTTFDELVLDITGTGDFELTNTGDLTLTSVTTGGNASFSTNGDLTLGAGSVGGNAAFTATAGDVIVSDTLTVGGNLTVDADDLRDVDGGVLTLAATNANITLRDAGPQAHNWTTTFGQLELAIDGIGDFSLTNSGALNLISVVNGGNTTITTDVGGLSIGTASVGGDAVFTGAGDLTMGSVSAGGNAEFTSTTGDITFGTGTIDGDTVFNATAGNVEVTGAQTFGGNLSLNTGDVILSGDSLVAGGDLTIEADDLRGAAADLTLSAANADITLRNGSAQNWATDFNQLALDIGGAGDFELTNTGALTLTSVNTEGNASFTTSNGSLTLGGGSIGGEAAFTATNGDVVMTSAPTVTGDLSLTTVGSGDVIVSDGLSVGGNLTVDADDLRDVDAGVLTLAATNANIILRDTGAQGRNWSTTFADLVLSLTGTGDFSLNNTGALALSLTTTGGTASFTSDGDLTLNSGDIGGNAALTANNGNVQLVTVPSVTGNLSLTTVGTGDVILSDDGLTVGGDLTVDAEDLRDSDGGELTLAATNANITLRNEDTQARDWTTTFEELVLDIAGTGDFNLTNTGDLTVTSATTGGSATFATEGGSLTMGTGAIGGDASFSATDGDLVFTSAPTVMGDLTLTTTGTGAVIVSDNGLIVGGVLTVDADDLRDGDADLTLTLTATSADITLRNTGSQARNWTTSFNELVLDIAGDGDFLLTNSSALDLISVTTGGNATFATNGGRLSVDSGDIGGDASFHAMDADLIFTGAPTVRGGLSLTTTGSGDIVLPTAGLLHDGALTIEADNLVADDIILGATDATITLRGGDLAQSWNTRFDTLALTIDGGGDFALEDTDGLTLTSVNTGGNTSFSTNNADLVLEGNPVVAGELSLLTVGGGDVVLPNAGLLHNGDLRIVADDLVGDSGPLIMSAANAIITLHGGNTAQTWNTTFDRLVLSIAGTGDFSLTDTDGLILASVTTGGNASFTTNDGDLVLTNTPVTAGALTLETVGSGDVVIPDAGLSYNGALTVTADRLRAGNTDPDSSAADIVLRATGLTANLRSHQQAAVWNTTVERLNLNTAGGGALQLNNTGALSVEAWTSDGAVAASTTGTLQLGTLAGTGAMAFTSGDDLVLLNSVYDIGGRLSLSAVDELRLASAGLRADTMTLTAARLTAAGGAPLILEGNSADLTVTASQALALTTRLGQLGVTYNGSAISINNDRDLVLDRFNTPNAATVGLSVSGTLTLPTTGLRAGRRLTLDAVDLRDDDRTMSFSAAELAVRLSGASGDHIWNVEADSLDALLRGQANLRVNANDGLVLEDLNNDSQAVLLENGNFTLKLASGDLTLAGAISAADLTADGVRSGMIDLEVAQGSVVTRGAASLTSTNLVDQSAGGDAISIRLTDISASDRDITLGDNSNSAITLRAIGGDILLNSRLADTAAGARRQVVQHPGVTIEAYDSLSDSLSGRVLLNGNQVEAQPWQLVRAGRTLAIVTDMTPQAPGSVLDELDDLDGATDVIRNPPKSGPNAADQFEQVFGICDELDRKNRHRCRVDDALKAFLSHWLVGGEMPPKSEMR